MRRRKSAEAPPSFELHPNDRPYNAQLAVAIVDDPGERGKFITATRSIRDDPLGGLYSRLRIDRAQLEAGRHFQRAYENAGLKFITAIDPRNEPVDGSPIRNAGFAEAQREGFTVLREAKATLGDDGYVLTVDVLGHGLSIQEIARRSAHGETASRYYGARFRECLESLARLWGYVSRP
jgi:hypothetical protein